MLTCPHREDQRDMPRQDREAFTVTITQLAQGEGGVLVRPLNNNNNTIIKVAEQYFGKCLGQSHYPKMLNCPHKEAQQGMPRVWCKQSNDLCCSGFAFPEGTTTLENGDLRVQQDREGFTVTVTQLAQGEGCTGAASCTTTPSSNSPSSTSANPPMVGVSFAGS
ncbi:hypothetical protein ANANG_G00218350 [Anguilla anguilla]|uniref:Uncharacterized protein n=1 Tax=Anguilla anguilla TaxID=7936 RepID=A0A9D3LVU7_ANGAN|nr:hypothetical protein ANANG_G00218350 [Anguilla anguilla]